MASALYGDTDHDYRDRYEFLQRELRPSTVQLNMKCHSRFQQSRGIVIAESVSHAATLTPDLWALMTYPLLKSSLAGNLYGAVKSCASVGVVSLALGAAMLALSPHGIAQITQGSGSSQQENRTSSMGSAPDSSASAVHESH